MFASKQKLLKCVRGGDRSERFSRELSFYNSDREKRTCNDEWCLINCLNNEGGDDFKSFVSIQN